MRLWVLRVLCVRRLSVSVVVKVVLLDVVVCWRRLRWSLPFGGSLLSVRRRLGRLMTIFRLGRRRMVLRLSIMLIGLVCCCRLVMLIRVGRRMRRF